MPEITTAQELKTALKALCAGIGPKATATILVGTEYSDVATVLVRELGGLSSENYQLCGATFEEAIEKARIHFVETAAARRAAAIRKMALLIITTTADKGLCEDRDLRCEFDATEVEAHGGEAVAQANQMAERDPFSIVTTGTGNHVLADVAAAEG